MSKASVAPKPKEPKPDRETLPLESVAITVTRPRLFGDEQEEEVPVTISGERLGEILRWAALACPNLEYFTKADIIGLELAGIADTPRTSASSAARSSSACWRAAAWASSTSRCGGLRASSNATSKTSPTTS